VRSPDPGRRWVDLVLGYPKDEVGKILGPLSLAVIAGTSNVLKPAATGACLSDVHVPRILRVGDRAGLHLSRTRDARPGGRKTPTPRSHGSRVTAPGAIVQ
jgi:hypothetical protein